LIEGYFLPNNSIMKAYSRTGDKGETSLIGGKRVPKYHDRIEAYGTVDELIAYIGLIRDQEISPDSKEYLLKVQDRLMTCAALLAVDSDTKEINLPEIYDGDIQSLEQEIDKMEEQLNPLNSFIIPGGHPSISHCHIARNVCRRAERNAFKLPPGHLNLDLVFKYLNRLSDYLFVLSRKLAKDLNIIENQWFPDK